MTSNLFSIIAPVLFGVSLGFFWAKLKKPFDMTLVTSLVFNIGTPLLVFSTLTELDIDPLVFGEIAMIAVIALAGFGVLSFAVLFVTKLPMRTYLASVMIPNSGNVGLPLCLLAFGQEGLAFGVIIYSVNSFAQFSFSVAVAAGSFSIKELARIPLLYAVALAVVVMLTDYQLPAWIANTTRLYGQLAIPIMLIALGVSLATLRVSSLPRSLALSVVRFSIGLGVGVAVSEIFGLEGVARGVMILQSAMPAAVFNYMLALRYDNDPPEVAGLIVTSTVFSFAIMPGLLLFVL